MVCYYIAIVSKAARVKACRLYQLIDNLTHIYKCAMQAVQPRCSMSSQPIWVKRSPDHC
jgi:hypothetical protein